MENLNYEKLDEIISGYKGTFKEHRVEEIYKWKAIKTFQDNWNIDAEDFNEMLKKSLKDSDNLLNSNMYFPKATIIRFSQKEQELTREMFRNLFDETVELQKRYIQFIDMSNKLLEKCLEEGKKHYQDAHTISTYLTFRYPDKYYMYKSSIDNTAAKFLDVKIYDRDKSKELENYFIFADKVLKHIEKDTELLKLSKNSLTKEHYRDSKFHILTWDLLFYCGTILKPKRLSKTLGKTILEVKREENFIGFHKWLKTNTDLKEQSIQHYCYALSAIEKEFLVKIESVTTHNEFKNIINFLSNNSNFKQKNSKCNNIYSAALKQYEKYIISKNTNNKEKYTKETFLKEVYITEKYYNNIVNILERKKNIILQGAPGVGKSFIAKRLAYSMMGEKDNERIKYIQFHQSYSYEDFIEGWRPNETSYELEKGIFYSFCKKAENDQNKDYFFIIDEINRGNLSKIFGELLMLIENDKREQKLNLAYSKMPFSVPNNVYIIGMMNTADRSLAIIDYALRRRFAFCSIDSAFDNEQFKNYQSKLNNNKFNKLIEVIKQLNIEIEEDPTLGSGFKIGHSYFCNLKDVTENEIESIIEYEILPLIKEYWFDDIYKYDVWFNKLNGVING